MTPASTGTADREARWLDDDDADSPCTYWGCDDGLVWGSDLGDPLWYDPDEIYACRSCGGTGLAKDMTLW